MLTGVSKQSDWEVEDAAVVPAHHVDKSSDLNVASHGANPARAQWSLVDIDA